MTRLRFGPRFQPTIADARYGYDERMDLRRPASWHVKAGSPEAFLRVGKALAAQRAKRQQNQEDDLPAAKRAEDASERMTKRVDDAIRLLEFGLAEFNENVIPGFAPAFNRKTVIAAIAQLKRSIFYRR